MKCLVKVSKNGRVLVPKKIRESLQLSEGSRVCLELKNGVLTVSTVRVITNSGVWHRR